MPQTFEERMKAQGVPDFAAEDEKKFTVTPQMQKEWDYVDKVAEILATTPDIGLGEQEAARKTPPELRPLLASAVRKKFAEQKPSTTKLGDSGRLATSWSRGFVAKNAPRARMLGLLPSLDPDQEKFANELVQIRQSEDPLKQPGGGFLGWMKRGVQGAAEASFGMVDMMGTAAQDSNNRRTEMIRQYNEYLKRKKITTTPTGKTVAPEFTPEEAWERVQNDFGLFDGTAGGAAGQPQGAAGQPQGIGGAPQQDAQRPALNEGDPWVQDATSKMAQSQAAGQPAAAQGGGPAITPDTIDQWAGRMPVLKQNGMDARLKEIVSKAASDITPEERKLLWGVYQRMQTAGLPQGQ